MRKARCKWLLGRSKARTNLSKIYGCKNNLRKKQRWLEADERQNAADYNWSSIRHCDLSKETHLNSKCRERRWKKCVSGGTGQRRDSTHPSVSNKIVIYEFTVGWVIGYAFRLRNVYICKGIAGWLIRTLTSQFQLQRLFSDEWNDWMTNWKCRGRETEKLSLLARFAPCGRLHDARKNIKLLG